MAPDPEYLRSVFNRLERLIEDRWSVPVHIQDVPNPFTGDLDGEQIMVDYDLDIEDALFILIHLFGHTVQWNVSAARREAAFLAPATWTDDQLAAAMEYEAEACRYSLQLLHDAGISDLDQWISDFAACDSRYLLHFYKTGEKLPFRSFWRDGATAITPLAIPEFSPTQWLSRRQGTVV
ncbi:MAG TPA: hypothetical protein VFK02_25000 [Kofleriaceae bacterium]|nr:hypothetical protein [Kofleriaceae bacterium]